MVTRIIIFFFNKERRFRILKDTMNRLSIIVGVAIGKFIQKSQETDKELDEFSCIRAPIETGEYTNTPCFQTSTIYTCIFRWKVNFRP